MVGPFFLLQRSYLMRYCLCTALLLVGFCVAVAIEPHSDAAMSKSPDPYFTESQEQRDARMAWWREARFGMFVHRGVYAVPAGTYQGSVLVASVSIFYAMPRFHWRSMRAMQNS